MLNKIIIDNISLYLIPTTEILHSSKCKPFTTMYPTFVFFLTIFVGIDSTSVPNSFIQINKFALNNDEFHFELNKFESIKNILINNLITTSDSLKAIQSLERGNEKPKIEQSLPNPNSMDILPRLHEDDLKIIKNQNENSFDLQSFSEANNFKDYKQNMEDRKNIEDLKNINKRQIGGGGGDNSQVVLGTFQAIMRPMPGLGSLGGGGQSVQNQNANVKESEGTEENNAE